MRCIYVLALLLVVACVGAAAQELDATEVAAYLTSWAQKNKDGAPGFAFAVVQGDRVVYEGGEGVEDPTADPPRPMTAQSVHRVASLSKTVLAAAALRTLVDSGTESPGDSVDADMMPLLPRGGDFLRLRSRQQGMTLREMLNHRAGFDDRVIAQIAMPEEGCVAADYAEWMQTLAAQPVALYGRGDVSSYSNYGATLAALAVEGKEGVPFAEYVAREILAPLGMADSGFDVPAEGVVPGFVDGPCRAFISLASALLTPVSLDVLLFFSSFFRLSSGHAAGRPCCVAA